MRDYFLPERLQLHLPTRRDVDVHYLPSGRAHDGVASSEITELPCPQRGSISTRRHSGSTKSDVRSAGMMTTDCENRNKNATREVGVRGHEREAVTQT